MIGNNVNSQLHLVNSKFPFCQRNHAHLRTFDLMCYENDNFNLTVRLWD
jgi:hypothetical protein